jgi:HSP20 family protein
MSPVVRRIFFEPAIYNFEECVWRPAVDVRRAPYGWLVKVELPGVTPEQVQIAMRGNSVFLWGVRRDTLLDEGESCYALEISYCRFERRIDLPSFLEDAEVRLASKDGLLILRLILSPMEPTR